MKQTNNCDRKARPTQTQLVSSSTSTARLRSSTMTPSTTGYHGVTTCKFVHTNVLNVLVNERIKQQRTCRKYLRPTWMTTEPKRKNWNQWENSLTSARTSRKKALVSSSQWPTGHFMDRELLNKTCDEMEQPMRQAITKTNQL